MERIVRTKAPYFKMQAVTGDGCDFMDVALDDYKGKWLVLLFYPMDFTLICPTEITAFSDHYEEFQDLNAEILAVSCDSVYSHQAWIEGDLGEVKFPIGSDKTMKASRDYGVLIEEEGISLRGLFLIGPDQQVRYSVVHDTNVGRSVDETIRVLKAFQTGGLCPINWKEGEPLWD
jgi:alkyl hydroperoxide reductase subunit AhpC